MTTGFTTIDLHGCTTEEAIERLTARLDQAMLRDCAAIRIIHGHGTGTLKTSIRQFLQQSVEQSFYVASFRPGGLGEGGDGVTVAELLR